MNRRKKAQTAARTPVLLQYYPQGSTQPAQIPGRCNAPRSNDLTFQLTNESRCGLAPLCFLRFFAAIEGDQRSSLSRWRGRTSLN